jgi:hypothetical protein
MDTLSPTIWLSACAHQLQQRWRTVDPLILEELAGDLWKDDRLRDMGPVEAARTWLAPVVVQGQSRAYR